MGRFYDNAKSACNKYDDAIVAISNLKSTYNECLSSATKITGIDEVEKLDISLNNKLEELNQAISKINSIKNSLKSKARELDEEEIRKAVEASKQPNARRQTLREIKADRL